MTAFRRPLGLVLSAGGALSSWQAGALRGLELSGLSFDSVLGVSAGALNGTAYALGMGEELEERWRRVDRSMLRFSPRIFPLSLFSDKPLLAALDFLGDDAAARKNLRKRLVVATARTSRKRRDYAVFDPATGAWNGPLLQKLAASCAIPVVFPTVVLSVEGGPARSFDGSVWCEEPFSFAALGPCKDVVVLEVVRHDELGRPARGFFDEIDLKARRTIRELMSQGAAGLRTRDDRPRVFRLAPSSPIPHSMLAFRKEPIAAGLSLGRQDAEAFLKQPEHSLAA